MHLETVLLIVVYLFCAY